MTHYSSTGGGCPQLGGFEAAVLLLVVDSVETLDPVRGGCWYRQDPVEGDLGPSAAVVLGLSGDFGPSGGWSWTQQWREAAVDPQS